jgi:uncharacterized integral membrane protein
MLKTLRKPTFLSIAIFDVVMTIASAYALHMYFKVTYPLWISIAATFVIGSLVHVVTGTPTMLNYYIGLSDKPVR